MPRPCPARPVDSRPVDFLPAGLPAFVVLATLFLTPGAPPACAQELGGVFPADTLVYAEWAGATALESPVDGTGVGRLLDEPSLQRLCKALDAGVRPWLEQNLSPSEREGFQQVLPILQGAFRHRWAFGLIDVGLGPAGPGLDAVLCIRAGSASGELHARLESLLGQGPRPKVEASIEGQELSRWTFPDIPLPLITGVVGQDVVIAIGEGGAARVVRGLAGADDGLASSEDFRRMLAEVSPRGGTLAFMKYANMPRLFERLVTLGRDLGQPLPEPVQMALKELGHARLGPIGYGLAIHQGGFLETIRVRVEGGLEPGPAVSDGLLRFVPRESPFFRAWHCDMAWWYRKLQSVLDVALDEAERMNLANQKASVEAMLSFDIETDVLAALGSRFLLYEDPALRSFIPGFVLVLEPRDPEALGKSLGRLVGMASSFLPVPVARPEVRSFDSHGSKISFLHLGGLPSPFAPAWAMVGDRMIIADSPAGVEHCLARVTADDARETSILTRPDFMRARNRVVGGGSALEYADIGDCAGLLYPFLIHLANMGLSMGASVGLDTDASMLPSPRVVRSHLFGEVTTVRNDDAGMLVVRHGPLPISVPSVGAAFAAGFFVGVTVPTVSRTRSKAETAVRMTDLRQLGMFCMVYSNDHGTFPPDLETLRQTEGFPASLLEVGPDREPLGYISGQKVTAPGGRVLVFDPNVDPDGNMSILLVSMAVERVPAAEAWERIQATRAAVEKKGQ